jgi:hypothetical protein
MRTFILIMASVSALASLGATTQAAEQKQANNCDQWRYVFHNEQWWYWLPEARWVYWQDNRWNDYHPQARHGATAGATVMAGAEQAVSTTPFILSAMDAARAESGKASAPETYRQDVSQSNIGPFYGKAGSAVGYPAMSLNSELGPYYGKAESAMGYPAIRPNSEIGPFYGKANSSLESPIDMGHFAGY